MPRDGFFSRSVASPDDNSRGLSDHLKPSGVVAGDGQMKLETHGDPAGQ